MLSDAVGWRGSANDSKGSVFLMLHVNKILTSLSIVTIGFCLATCKSDSTDSNSDAGDHDANVPSGGVGGHSGHAANSGSGSSGSGGKLGTGGNSGAGGKQGTAGNSGSGGKQGAAGRSGSGGGGDDAGVSGMNYAGPTVGSAKQFAVLAYNSVTTANVSTIEGMLGVSAAAVSVITGFDDPGFTKYGNDSLAPHADTTGLAQIDVTSLVGNIDPRACDKDLTNVVGGLTGDITLHPGVTCMNSASADILINGHVYLDAGGDSDAFFVIRGNKAMNVADGAQVVLMNGAQNCGIFWRISAAVTIGKTVDFHGTVIAGTAITMKTGSTLSGRALAQTAGVQLDANSVSAPTDGDCPHLQ
jgi:hypothetical protein